MISISGVSAASTAYVNTTGNDTTGDGSSENPYLTIQKGIDSVNPNGTIYIAEGTYKDTGNNNLTINKNMTIIGQSQASTIIDGQGQGSIFTINQGITVILTNLTLTNTGTTKNGGAINNNGTLSVSNCNFTQNTAYYGGAIYNMGTLEISNSTFTSNTASKGGAIYNNEGQLTANNSIIEYNTAAGTLQDSIMFAGGAGIFNDLNSDLTIENCIIQNNSVTASGEGLDVRSFGGGICNGGNLFVDNCIIQNNNVTATATLQGRIISAEGGGIYNDNILIINNSIIQNNTITATADEDVIIFGAGIFNSDNGNVYVDNCTIQYNNAITTTDAGVGVYGGGICNNGNLYINDSSIQFNTVAATTPGINRIGGGAISNSYIGNVYIDKSTIQYNSVTATGGDIFVVGGAIYNENVLIITNSTIAYNNVTTIGGDEYSQIYGGGICNFGEMVANFNRIINNSPTAIDHDAESAPDLQYNWWGSNDPVWSNIIYGCSPPDNWVILSVNATPNIINNTKTSTVTADFNHINGGGVLTGGHIPDGLITLEVPWGRLVGAISGTGNLPLLRSIGSVSPVSDSAVITHSITLNTINGVIAATFYANEGAINPLFNPVKVTATADSYTTNNVESAYITINKASNLYINITSNNNNPQVGETFKITYKLGNKGPDAATNVIITIPLPEGFEISQITGDGKWTYNANTNTITWTLKNVPVGDPYLYISGHVNKPGRYVFSSSIFSDTYNISTEGVTPATINTASEVKAASKTIPMQETGLPLSGLILAILAVISGFTTSKRK